MAESSTRASTDDTQKMGAILKYLQDQKTKGGVGEGQEHSLDVAIQSLETAYGVSTQDDQLDTTSSDALLDTLSPQATGSASSTFPPLQEPSPEDKLAAEILKTRGNKLMDAERFSEAVNVYTQAIEKDGTSAVYYSNRAAAYSKLRKHDKAIEDCQSALSIDPTYSKAYGRMGIAYTAVGNHESAVACQRKALELDPDNHSYRTNLQLAQQKLRGAAAEASRKPSSGETSGSEGEGYTSFLGRPDFLRKITSLAHDPRSLQILSDFTNNPSTKTKLSGLLQVGQLLVDHFVDE